MKKILTIAIVIAIALTSTLAVFATTSDNTTPSANSETTTDVTVPTTEIINDNTVVEVTNDISENNEITTHVCKINRANEDYHRYSCEECDNFSYVFHNEETMSLLVKNAFFHTWECTDCGYSYTEEHNFATAYNSVEHTEVCVDCGYETVPEAHVMVNYFYGDYHDIQCDFCGYMAEHHVGAKYETVDSINCEATCRCGIVETLEHDWDGFICDNCDYTMSGDTYAVVSRVTKNEDGYRVRFTDISGTHRIDMWDISELKEGDFVKISHYGNDIFDITVLVDGDIITDEENFYDYILSDEVNEMTRELTFEDLVIEEFEYSEDHLRVNFESTRSTWFFNDNFIVYDLMEGEISELQEGYAYLTLYVDDTAYFICFW